jgi:asparagine synthase (glutamine-hydrolysing)
MTEEDKAVLAARAPGARPALDQRLPADRHLRRLWADSALAGGNRLLHVDVQSFLVDNLLAYTDRMAMAVSMEVRVPMLEPEFVEYALNVPFTWKLPVLGTRGKAIMRDTFGRFLAPEVRRAGKKGFNAPLGVWLRGELDAYFEASQRPGHPLRDALGADVGATWRDGVLEWQAIDRMRAEHRSGRQDLSHELFAVIVFDVWWRKYVTGTLPLEHWSPARAAGVA